MTQHKPAFDSVKSLGLGEKLFQEILHRNDIQNTSQFTKKRSDIQGINTIYSNILSIDQIYKLKRVTRMTELEEVDSTTEVALNSDRSNVLTSLTR